MLTADWWRHLGASAFEKGLITLLILVTLWIVRLIFLRAIDLSLNPPWTRDKLDERQNSRISTLQGILKNIVSYLLIIIGGIQIVKTIGGDKYDITPILTTVGVGGLAIGFGAQKLVRDAIAGFFILLEDQYSVGDYVTISDVTGVIDSVGIRITRIRDDQGRLITMPNGDISKVTNYSRGAVENYLEVSVTAASDLEKVSRVIEAVGAKFEAVGVLENPTLQGVAYFDATKVTLKILVKSDPKRQMAVLSDLRESLRTALIESEVTLA
jgi:small conductance mechanosensitive channel